MSRSIKNESDVKREVAKSLKEYRGVWVFMPVPCGYGRSGIPDFIGCFQNRFFAVETKFGSNKPTPAQKMELKKIHESMGIAMIINETNLDILEEVLEDLSLGLYTHARGLSRSTLLSYGVEV